jgi:hypothetical protein
LMEGTIHRTIKGEPRSGNLRRPFFFRWCVAKMGNSDATPGADWCVGHDRKNNTKTTSALCPNEACPWAALSELFKRINGRMGSFFWSRGGERDPMGMRDLRSGLNDFAYLLIPTTKTEKKWSLTTRCWSLENQSCRILNVVLAETHSISQRFPS